MCLVQLQLVTYFNEVNKPYIHYMRKIMNFCCTGAISSGFSSFVRSKWSQRGSLDDSGASTVGAKETICHLKFAFLMNFLFQLTYSFQLFFL